MENGTYKCIHIMCKNVVDLSYVQTAYKLPLSEALLNTRIQVAVE